MGETTAKQKCQGKASILPESKDVPLIQQQGDIRHESSEVVAVLSSLMSMKNAK
jgi:hypothetical protein